MAADHADLGYTISVCLNDERSQYVTNKLIEFNQAHRAWRATDHPVHECQPLHVFVLNREGAVVGGLIGETHYIWGWLDISILWVSESSRGQGLGRQLLARAEEEARQRGCQYARTSTSDYQAPGFYKKQGYLLYGKLANLPAGETTYSYWKALE